MSRKVERRIGNVGIKRNRELRYTYYRVGRPNVGSPVEIYVSDEIADAGVSPKRLRQLALSELDRISKVPYGETSIDPHVSDPTARNERAVNHVSDAVQSEINVPLAIKSSTNSGPKVKRDLIGQFEVMRELQITAENRLGEIGEVLEFLPVYGAVKIDRQQFLIMKYIKDAKEIDDVKVPYASYGWAAGGDPISELAFKRSEHPELVDVLNMDVSGETVRWRSVASEIGFRLRKPLGDLAGRNVLQYQNGAEKKYVVIDQVRKGTY